MNLLSFTVEVWRRPARFIWGPDPFLQLLQSRDRAVDESLTIKDSLPWRYPALYDTAQELFK
jgi:hypothetical protein